MRPSEPHDPHERITVVTWRIPQTTADALEEVHLDDATVARIRAVPGIEEVFTLSTCQRRLVAILPAHDPGAATGHPGGLAGALALAIRPEGAAGLATPEVFRGWDAVAHLTTVAAGLDALVVGEPQVLGQFRDAIKAAATPDRSNDGLGRMLDRVLRVARTVRESTGIGRGAVSLVPRARPAIEAVATRGGRFDVAVVGTGRMAHAVVDELARHPVTRLVVVSRSVARATRFAEDAARRIAAAGEVEPLTRAAFTHRPPAVDLVVLATDHGPEDRRLPLVDAALCDRIQSAREQTPQATSKDTDPGFTIIDLGMPRLADPALHARPGCRLLQIDDLAHDTEEPDVADGRHHKVLMAWTRLEEELGRWRRRAAAEHESHRIHDLHATLTRSAEEALGELSADMPQDDGFRRWYRKTTRRLAHLAVAHLQDALASGKHDTAAENGRGTTLPNGGDDDKASANEAPANRATGNGATGNGATGHGATGNGAADTHKRPDGTARSDKARGTLSEGDAV